MSKKEIVVGLDIGTTKICCLVAKVVSRGVSPQVDILGFGLAASTGLRKGVVINIDTTIASIRQAVEGAEAMAGVEISTVYAGIAGGHIKSFNSTGVVAVKDQEINDHDVQRVIEAAKAVAIPLDRETLHIIPQEYTINEQGGIRDPIGMSGVRLEARVHIVTGAVSSAQNIIKCVNRAGLNVAEICLEPIASSEAVLCRDEKELGVILIDIGGGTTDLAIFKEGALVHTGVLPMGGHHLTHDIAVGLRTPQHEAELLKMRYGCALVSLVKAEETMEVPGVGGRQSRLLSRRLLAQIIEPRMEEIFSLIQREVLKSGYHHLLSAGVVITGGATLLPGTPELAELVFGMPVKRGIPSDMGGMSESVQFPQFATAVGLAKYGARQQERGGRQRFPLREKNIYDKFRGSVRNWMRELF